MKLAVMQPYFFPYIGYWQLVHAADKFVVLDDVNFIKAGWVNRNRILVNGKPTYITVPIQKASQNRLICDTNRAPSQLWCEKTLKTVTLAYRRAPYLDQIFPDLSRMLQDEACNLSDYLVHQLQALVSLMGIDTPITTSSRSYANSHLRGQERILDICRQESASEYINLPGGHALYDSVAFSAQGITLRFLVTYPIPHPQRASRFIPNLSIIDTLMEVGTNGIDAHLQSCDLVAKAMMP